MIVIIDYGIGNLHSVSKALEKLGFENQISKDPDLVEKAPALILPGVGSFGEAVEQMEKITSLMLSAIQFKKESQF